MIAYTTTEIFTLLGNVNCQSDIIEIWHYIQSHKDLYNDVSEFEKTIDIYLQLFI